MVADHRTRLIDPLLFSFMKLNGFNPEKSISYYAAQPIAKELAHVFTRTSSISYKVLLMLLRKLSQTFYGL